MTRETVYDRLAEYVRRSFLGGESIDLEPRTPLLEWGILNSMNTAKLLTFIREELSVEISPIHITGTHFKNLETITDLVQTTRAESVGK